MEPGPVQRGDDTLGAQDDAVFLLLVQGLQDAFQLLRRELPGRLPAPGGEDLVGVVLPVVVMVVMMLVVMFVLMFIIVVMVVVMMVLMFVVIVVIMVMLVLMMVVVVVVLVVMMLPALLAVAVLVMLVVVVIVLMGQEGLLPVVLLLGRCHDLLSVQLVPGSGDDGGVGVDLPQELKAGFQLLRVHVLGAA